MNKRAFIGIAAVLCAAATGGQPIVTATSDLVAKASDFNEPVTDSITIQPSIAIGGGIVHDVFDFSPLVPDGVTASTDFTISPARIVAPVSSSSFLYEVDVTGTLTRSMPIVFEPGLRASADLELVFDFSDFVAARTPLGVDGFASYTSTQPNLAFSEPAFQLLGRSSGVDTVLASLQQDGPAGTLDFSASLSSPEIVLQARSDISDQLTFDDGTTELTFGVTFVFLGPVPAPSSAALLGLAGLLAARRRR